MHLSHILARWSLEVVIDKYNHFIPVCLLGLNVSEKMQCQNNTDNQIMMNEGNKCLSHSLITLPPHRGREGGDFTGKGKKMRAALNIPPPPRQKPIVCP